jgi:hypothetical protein
LPLETKRNGEIGQKEVWQYGNHDIWYVTDRLGRPIAS